MAKKLFDFTCTRCGCKFERFVDKSTEILPCENTACNEYALRNAIQVPGQIHRDRTWDI